MASEFKRRLREQSEHYLLLDAAKRLGKDVGKPYGVKEGRFWRLVFVPLYRRVPWHVKARAMRALRMTASGWPEGRRPFGEPWRPPSGTGDGRG